MRQIGTLPTQQQAERLTAFLITEGVAAVTEADDNHWAIWVRDEDHLDQAKTAYEHFREQPDDARYEGVFREANAILQAEEKRREEARKNVVQVRGQWRSGASQRTPLVTAIIALCILVFFFTGGGFNAASITYRTLSFTDPVHTLDTQEWDEQRTADRLIDVGHGELWRLMTPIFLHGDLLHLAFNMFWLYSLGTRIEHRFGAWKFGLLILMVAVFSNTAQGLAPETWGPLAGNPFFGGMSGVVYGLLGFLWMKTMYDPESGLYVANSSVVILVVWMLLCMVGVIGGVANMAHLAGLLSGMAIGHGATLLRQQHG